MKLTLHPRLKFDEHEGVCGAGVLFLLPALLAQGLLKTKDVYKIPDTHYYGLESIVLTLVFMALAGLKILNQIISAIRSSPMILPISPGLHCLSCFFFKSVAYFTVLRIYYFFIFIYSLLFRTLREEKRMLVKQIIQNNADLIPDYQNKTLTVVLHSLSTPRFNEAAAKLTDVLNKTETIFPGTDLTLKFKSSAFSICER